ncbi:MAG: hypothetical protein FWD89_01875 [Firmicutes bacterium]|nr:hypothetical protein [Bacillota bacterium]
MEIIEQNLRIASMYDIYFKLLTDKQQEYMTAYYFDNLSIVEIAKKENVSTQSVSDLLIRTVKKLEKYEEALALLERGR